MTTTELAEVAGQLERIVTALRDRPSEILSALDQLRGIKGPNPLRLSVPERSHLMNELALSTELRPCDLGILLYITADYAAGH